MTDKTIEGDEYEPEWLKNMREQLGRGLNERQERIIELFEEMDDGE